MKRSTVSMSAALAAVLFAPTAHATPQTSLSECQQTVAKAGARLVANSVTAMSSCLRSVSDQLIKKNQPDVSGATAKCVTSFRALVNATAPEKTLSAKFVKAVTEACDPASPGVEHTLGDVLGLGALPQQTNAHNLDAWCRNFGGDGSVDSVEEWIDCMAAANSCSANVAVATNFPRALEWLAAVRTQINAMTPVPADALAALTSVENVMEGLSDDNQPELHCGALLKVDGASCASDTECISGACVDAVCCNTTCVGTCQACSAARKGGGADGTCENISAGTDPNDECGIQLEASCGTSGMCDGSGACAVYSFGTPCGEASCSGSTQTDAPSCDGAGSCLAAGTTDCTPYTCDLSVCKTMCSTESDCVAGYICSGGACVALKLTGDPCGSSGECASGDCVDGVCCNSACTGLCQACSAARKGSGADGLCGDIAGGGDPDDECVAQAATTCGTTGRCDGSGACALHPLGTACGTPSCSGSTQTNAPACDGAGTCQPAGTTSCAPYVCGATTCKTSCSSPADCTAGNTCSSNACAPLKTNGDACSLSSECLSNRCIDGVCCNAACFGACQACNAANTGGANGTCANILFGTDPDDECPGATTCNGAGGCTP